MTLGLKDVCIAREDRRKFLPRLISRLAQDEGFMPFFYLDAHSDEKELSCPLLEELQTILCLKRYIVLIDDFAVPNSDFLGRSYGVFTLNLETIYDFLVSGGVKWVFFPAYPLNLERGYASTGYVLILSERLGSRLPREEFPFNLLRAYKLYR